MYIRICIYQSVERCCIVLQLRCSVLHRVAACCRHVEVTLWAVARTNTPTLSCLIIRS